MLLELLGSVDPLSPLRTHPYRPGVTLRDRALWERVEPEVRRRWIERGERYSTFEWPALTEEMYADYSRTGERSAYEPPYHRRRQAVAALLLAEGFENRGRFVPALQRGLGLILDEPTWVLPAHPGEVIDIFSAETGNLLAWALHVLEAEPATLPPELGARIRHAVRGRLIEPYLSRSDFWWMGDPAGRVGNWTTWCTSNCLGAVLLMEADPERRWRALEKACSSLDLFLEGSGEDGGCDEGPTYWNFAAGSLFDCLEMLYDASGGAFDAFGEAAVRRLGEYIYKVHVHDLHFVNFADSLPEVPIDAALMYRFGRRIGDAHLQALGAHLYRLQEEREPENGIRLKAYRALATLADEPALRSLPAPARVPREAYFPKLQVMVARETERPGAGLVLAAKGGHNDEGHNHNDVGNVVVYLDGRPVIIDVGMKQYTRDSFSEKRYEIWAMQSAYHNVPLLNDTMQAHGPAFGAREARFWDGAHETGFAADIAGSYPEAAGILGWRRQATLRRGEAAIRIEETFEFRRERNSFELRFMSCLQPDRVEGGLVYVLASESRLLVTARPAPTRLSVHEFTLHDPQMLRAWGRAIYQARLRYERVPRRGACRVTVAHARSGTPASPAPEPQPPLEDLP